MHGSDAYKDDTARVCQYDISSNYYQETGATILPESAHTSKCKLCKRSFHAQSKSAILDHLRNDHGILDDFFTHRYIKYNAYVQFYVDLFLSEIKSV